MNEPKRITAIGEASFTAIAECFQRPQAPRRDMVAGPCVFVNANESREAERIEALARISSEQLKAAWLTWLRMPIADRRAAPESSRPYMACELCRHYASDDTEDGNAGMCDSRGHSVWRMGTCPQWRGDGSRINPTPI